MSQIPPIAFSAEEIDSNKCQLKKKKIRFNASTCKYDIVKECALALQYQLVDDTQPWSFYWIDTGVSIERILEM